MPVNGKIGFQLLLLKKLLINKTSNTSKWLFSCKIEKFNIGLIKKVRKIQKLKLMTIK